MEGSGETWLTRAYRLERLAQISARMDTFKRAKMNERTKEEAQDYRARFARVEASLTKLCETTSPPLASPLRPTPAGTTTSITKRPTFTSIPPPDSDNPYSDWDPRHAPRNLYLHEATRRALQEEAASITLQRWLTKRVFINNFNRHLRRRTHTRQLCRGASSYAKELVSTGKIKGPAPAPSINSSPIIPRRTHQYPSAEETHAFRHRGLPLPIIPSKKKKRRKRYKRCIRPPPRTRKSSSTSSPSSHLPSICHVIHPTEGCQHCPAFFIHRKDLETHLLQVHHEDFNDNKMSCLDKVPSTDETTISPVDNDLPQNPCPPSPSTAQSSSPTHRSNTSSNTDLERHQDRVPSTDETPPVSTDDAILPQNPYPPAEIIISELLPPIQASLNQASHLNSFSNEGIAMMFYAVIQCLRASPHPD